MTELCEMKAEILDEKITSAADTLENLIANLGTEHDKRSYSRFVNGNNLSQDKIQLDALYRTDWLAGKVVDIVPDDMCREWREFQGEIDPDVIKLLEKEENRLNLVSAFNDAHKWARLYGTAFIVLSVDDGQTPDKPLDFNRIKKGGLKHLKVVDRHRLTSDEYQIIADPLDPSFGLPRFYRVNETSVRIHHSRVLRFEGVKLPFDEFRRNNYFNDSVLARLYDAITNYNTTTNSAASMVYETNVDIVKIKGLMNYLQTARGEELIRKRFTLAKVLKSFNNMMLLDSEETAETKTNTFAGLPELIDRFSQALSAASDIPATRLLGTSASGLNATGEGDLKNYYDTVRSAQIRDYEPRLNYIDKIIAKSLGLPDDVDLTFDFRSLFQETPKNRADRELVNAQRDQIYLSSGVVNELIVAKELKQEQTYTNLDKWIEELELLTDLDDFDNEMNNDDGLNNGTDTDTDPTNDPE